MQSFSRFVSHPGSWSGKHSKKLVAGVIADGVLMLADMALQRMRAIQLGGNAFKQVFGSGAQSDGARALVWPPDGRDLPAIECFSEAA
jgi:hypothetical protein